MDKHYKKSTQLDPVVPDGVAVAPGTVAPRVYVALLGARVVLDQVAGRTLLDLDALVPAGEDDVLAHQVVVALVRSVRLPLPTCVQIGAGVRVKKNRSLKLGPHSSSVCINTFRRKKETI